MRSDLIDLDVVVVINRPRAWGVDDGTKVGPRKELIWIPKSQAEVEFKETGAEKGDATLTVPRWLAHAKGLV